MRNALHLKLHFTVSITSSCACSCLAYSSSDNVRAKAPGEGMVPVAVVVFGREGVVGGISCVRRGMITSVAGCKCVVSSLRE